MKKFLLFVLLVVLSANFSDSYAQNISYEVDITNQYSDECDDCNGPPDYRMFHRLLANNTIVANWNPYYENSPWCLWFGAALAGGIGTNFNFYSNSNAPATTFINFNYRAYEEDPIQCDNPCFFCTNGGPNDGTCDSYETANGNLTLRNYTEGVFHTFDDTRSCNEDDVTIIWGVEYRFRWNYLPLNTPPTPTASGSNCSVFLNPTSSTQTAVQWYWQTSTTGTNFTNAANNPPGVPNNATTTFYLRPYGLNSGQWGTASAGLTISKNCAFWCFTEFPNPPSVNGSTNVSTASGWQNNVDFNGDFADNSLVIEVNVDAANYGNLMQLSNSITSTSLINNNANTFSTWNGSNPEQVWRLATDNPFGSAIDPGQVSINVCGCKPASFGAINSTTGTVACPEESFTLSHNGSTSSRFDNDGYGEELRWFTGSCGGTPAGNGLSINVVGNGVETTRTYYAQFFTNGTACGGCEQYTVTFIDNVQPSITCPGTQSDFLDLGCNWFVPDYRSLASVSDNCVASGDLTITQTPTPGTVVSSSAGTNENVTILVDDGYGNSRSCSFAVTVQDNINPVAICQNYTLQLNSIGNGTLTTANVDGGSNDNCSTPSLSLSKTSFDCNDIGTNNVTLTANDGNGNTNSCTVVVTVEDNVAPNAICQNYNLFLDEFGNGSITTANVNNGSNDACGIASISLSKTNFTCGDIGNNSVVMTVTDNNGNVSTCTATVTVFSANSSALLVSGTTTTATLENCTDGNGWTYYSPVGNPSRFIFGIKKNGNSFAADVKIVDKSGSATYSSTGGAGPDRGTWLIGRYWDVTITSGTINSPVDVRFFVDPAEVTQASNEADAFMASISTAYVKTPLTFFKTPDGVEFDPNTAFSAGNFSFQPSITWITPITNTIDGVTYYELTGISDFSGGTGGFSVSDNVTPLPVELISWKATAIDNTYIQLDWSTATEINNSGFELRRSTDGINFDPIAWVDGNGNSTEVNNYTYNDEEVSNGTYYYQLKQVDFNGDSETFDIVNATINSSNGFSIGSFVPNPADSRTELSFFAVEPTELEVVIFNNLGQLVKTEKLRLTTGKRILRINTESWNAGTYNAIIKANGETYTRRLMVVK